MDSCTYVTIELVMQPVMKYATDAFEPFKDGARGYPDPSFIFQLPDEISFGSNFYAVQKSYDGPFQFDVFYENSKKKLSCEQMSVSSENVLT